MMSMKNKENGTTLATRKLAMEIRLSRTVTNLKNVSARLVHPTHSEQKRQPCLFDRLVDDVLLYIGTAFLSHNEVWALTLVCRRVHSLFTPLLYHNVQLLLQRTADRPGSAVNNREATLLAQKVFRTNLKRRPYLNSNIRIFKFYLDNRETRESLYDTLRPMQNVEDLYISTPYGSPLMPEDTAVSRACLLPKCKRITLEGIISLEFARLLIHPSQIEFLGIDFQPKWAAPIVDWMTASPTAFPRLKKLQFRFPGGHALPGRMETELLQVWSHALLTFRLVLEEVVISTRVTETGCFNVNSIQPRISKLQKVIFPIFSEEKWPKLRKLTLRGLVVKPEESVGALRAAVPELTIDPEIDMTDYLWHNHFAYSPTLR